MDIWQGTTVLTSLGWDQFNGLELFANADNSFSVGTAAKLAGSGASYFSSLSANIDTFGFAPLDALQQFTINIPGLGDSPVAAITDAYAIQKLNNGHWVIAYRSPTSTANVSETIVAEFDANLHLLAIANQGTAMSPGPYDLSSHGNNAYTLTYTNFNPFTLTGTRGFSDDLKISTSPTGAPSTTASTFWDGQNFRQADDIDPLSTDETGTSRVYWLEIDSGKGGTFRPASVKSQLFDATGAALSPTRTIWDGSSCETTSAGSDRGGLDVAKGSGFEYVAWATHNPDSSDGEDVMIAIVTPVPFAVTTVSMRQILNLSVSSDGYRLDQVEVLANGNVAVLWTINNSNSPEDSVHVTILKSDGALVEDFITTALDDAAHLSITELSDGRIALAGGVQISGAPGTSAPADIA